MAGSKHRSVDDKIPRIGLPEPNAQPPIHFDPRVDKRLYEMDDDLSSLEDEEKEEKVEYYIDYPSVSTDKKTDKKKNYSKKEVTVFSHGTPEQYCMMRTQVERLIQAMKATTNGIQKAHIYENSFADPALETYLNEWTIAHATLGKAPGSADITNAEYDLLIAKARLRAVFWGIGH